MHVLDASRSVPVVSELLNPDTRDNFQAKFKEEYRVMRKDHESRQELKNYIPLKRNARENRTKVDWPAVTFKKPTFTGRKEL
ncbi:MAG: hypothetical protein U5K54_17295 [Cytophagales bacterium]|nr:hypothetical protein [Cytophagales bacterium]